MSAHDEQQAKIGDWVRFYQNGKLVIAVVQYTKRDILGYAVLQTDAGEVRADNVLETREVPHA